MLAELGSMAIKFVFYLLVITGGVFAGRALRISKNKKSEQQTQN